MYYVFSKKNGTFPLGYFVLVLCLIRNDFRKIVLFSLINFFILFIWYDFLMSADILFMLVFFNFCFWHKFATFNSNEYTRIRLYSIFQETEKLKINRYLLNFITLLPLHSIQLKNITVRFVLLLFFFFVTNPNTSECVQKRFIFLKYIYCAKAIFLFYSIEM